MVTSRGVAINGFIDRVASVITGLSLQERTQPFDGGCRASRFILTLFYESRAKKKRRNQLLLES
jgi:hypothetical protein